MSASKIIVSSADERVHVRTVDGDIVVRPVTSPDDFRACVHMQLEVWGRAYTDYAPATLLQVSTYVGGIVLGAFSFTGDLVGFVFGFTGVADGESTHWSHMLGVRESVRNLGVGRLLKNAQRAELARRGVKVMSWTFDPLGAKNAHLNLNLLAARVVKYVPDMYGTTASPLHYGLPTDRLIVAVDTMEPNAGVRMRPSHIVAPILSPQPRANDTLVRRGDLPPSVRIEIPPDIGVLVARSIDEVATWRAAVNEHFRWALGRGYRVTGLSRDARDNRAFYTLTRDPA